MDRGRHGREGGASGGEEDGISEERLAPLTALTPAERRVLRLVARGLTTPEIADTLGNSPRTIESHRSHICRKLGLTGPQSLLRFALRRESLLD